TSQLFFYCFAQMQSIPTKQVWQQTEFFSFGFTFSDQCTKLSEKRLLQRRIFMFEQPLLAPESACITGQGAISTDNTMAWNHNPKWIFPVCRCDCAYCFDIAEFF